MCALKNGIVMLFTSLSVSPAWADLESAVSQVVIHRAKLDIQMKRNVAQKKLPATEAKESNNLSAKNGTSKVNATEVAPHSTGVLAKNVSAHLAISPGNSKPNALK